MCSWALNVFKGKQLLKFPPKGLSNNIYHNTDNLYSLTVGEHAYSSI